MKRLPKPWNLGLILMAAWLAGCSATSLQTPSQRRPYDRESSSLHPEITLHRRADASELDVYLRVPREELLYSRLDASSPFIAQLRIDVGDTSWHMLDTAWEDTPRLLTQRWTLRTSPLPIWEEITVVDVLRNASWSSKRNVAPSDRLGSNDVLVWSTSEGWPLSGEHAQIGDTLLLHLPPQLALPSLEPVVWDMSNAASPNQLPPPPYSSARLRWDTLRPTALGSLQADSLIVLVVPDGTTLLQLRGTNLALRFHGRTAHFPELIGAEELVAPLRYIASRSEFNRLSTADHPKLALDQFWLACGSSSESARGLLNTYYSRVEEANLAFSGMVEGWRTDRGMIHVVFGVPQRVRRDAWNEYWIYGEEGTANALTFHFRKKSNALDNNHFELQRSIQFRSVWDRGISNWRNGRVRGD
jgi:GWxTD domain-containing protein